MLFRSARLISSGAILLVLVSLTVGVLGSLTIEPVFRAIRLEKIANGTLTTASNCNDIKDQEVFDRLKAMGATTIMQTPIMVNSGGYFEGNTNKVFIGYSRTDDTKKAIRHIAIKVEILSMAEPKETIEVNNKKFNLVAEAADGVTALPKAINLIGIQGGGELLLPRFYLYYSTSSGSDPICDITIDDIPILNGWNTVRSANLTDPFAINSLSISTNLVLVASRRFNILVSISE